MCVHVAKHNLHYKFVQACEYFNSVHRINYLTVEWHLIILLLQCRQNYCLMLAARVLVNGSIEANDVEESNVV